MDWTCIETWLGMGLITEGCVAGKHDRGKPRMEYIRQLIEDQGRISDGLTTRKTSNREE